MKFNFDLIVIGSGPAGESGALKAARLGKSVALIDNRTDLGGNCCHTGTLPSKTLRESSMAMSHARDQVFLPSFRASDHSTVSMEDFVYRTNLVIRRETERLRALMEQNGVVVFIGKATFVDAHTVKLPGPDAADIQLHGDYILIACGSRPVRPSTVPFDGKQIFDSDEILALKQLPRSLIILGGGVIGSEYATIFSNLGIPVQLVDSHRTHLPFIDREIIERLHGEIAKRPLTLELGVALSRVSTSDKEVLVTLANGRVLRAEAALYALGRTSNADGLCIDRAGILADHRSTITVDKDYRTNIPHIAAAGDVIGFPALASTSWEQGRVAVRALFGGLGIDESHLIPYGIYTIPEISAIGLTEEQASSKGMKTVTGRCEIGKTARGIISGDNGLLKLVFEISTRKILGAYCIGARATDIIHTAMMCIRFHGTIEDLSESVFNYPTVSDAIKVAALHARWQLDTTSRGIGMGILEKSAS